MTGRLSGKTAIVTGGVGGLGQAIARAYVEAGATVCVADLRLEAAEATAAALGAALGEPGAAFGLALDVTRQDSIDAMVDAVATRTGGIDILVNNAGRFDLEPFFEITRAGYDRVFDVNVRGLLFTLQAAARRMAAQGRGGKIVNIASGAGRRGAALPAVYCASKAAVISLTQSAALALVPHRINVNAIAPGMIETPMAREVETLFARHLGTTPEEVAAMLARESPQGRIARPEDFPGVAVFLASSDSDFITGQTLNVDGGLFMN